MISIEQLKEKLEYNEKIGIFKWKIDNQNQVCHNDIAGTIHSNGYVYIKIDGETYRAHKLAWFYYYGVYPKQELDHINKIKSDNRITNLREITHINNLRNTKIYKNNTSSVKGVTFDKSRNKWRAQIVVNQHTYNLGRFKDFDEAVCTRLIVEQCLNWLNSDASSPAHQYVRKNIQRR